MKRLRGSYILVLCLITTLNGLETMAAERSPAGSSDGQARFSTQFGSGINVITQGATTTNRATIFSTLLGANGSAGWPAYPRLWYEEFDADVVISNTYWHPKLMALNGGIEIEYKYGRKTTLVMVTSTQTTTAAGSKHELIEANDFQVVRSDPKLHRTVPVFRKGVPMVGFCSFELSLVTTKGVSGGFELLGAGSKLEKQKAHGAVYTIYSKFFEIPQGLTVSDIFATYCNNEFEKKIRAQAETNFIPVIVEQTVWSNPRSTCTPTTIKNENGDASCQEWFNGFDRVRKHVSVARCETQRSGVSMCVLKAKPTMRCPLYEDRAGKVYTDVTKFGLQELTKNTFAFQCDQGSTCTMTAPPTRIFGGLVLFKGDSFCRPKAGGYVASNR